MKRLHFKDAVGHELAITAVAANDGDLGAAVRDMATAGYEVTEAAMATVARNKSTEVAETRQQLAPKLEKLLTADLLDESMRATQVIGMAIQRTEERLVANMVADPSKVARDLAQVRTQGIDKRLALEGRPTSITESRSPDEIVRALEGMGVAKQVAIEGTAVEVEAEAHE